MFPASAMIACIIFGSSVEQAIRMPSRCSSLFCPASDASATLTGFVTCPAEHQPLLLGFVGDREIGVAREAVMHLDDIDPEFLQGVDRRTPLGCGAYLDPALPR